jgi:hypothetical protein
MKDLEDALGPLQTFHQAVDQDDSAFHDLYQGNALVAHAIDVVLQKLSETATTWSRSAVCQDANLPRLMEWDDNLEVQKLPAIWKHLFTKALMHSSRLRQEREKKNPGTLLIEKAPALTTVFHALSLSLSL